MVILIKKGLGRLLLLLHFLSYGLSFLHFAHFFSSLFDWVANHKRKASKVAPTANVMDDRSMSKRLRGCWYMDSVSRGCCYMAVFLHEFMSQVSWENTQKHVWISEAINKCNCEWKHINLICIMRQFCSQWLVLKVSLHF